jgi:hypothetical protein
MVSIFEATYYLACVCPSVVSSLILGEGVRKVYVWELGLMKNNVLQMIRNIEDSLAV